MNSRKYRSLIPITVALIIILPRAVPLIQGAIRGHIDCDDYALFNVRILRNLGIPYDIVYEDNTASTTATAHVYARIILPFGRRISLTEAHVPNPDIVRIVPLSTLIQFVNEDYTHE